MGKTPRILLYDIESSPNVGYTWGKYEQNVLEFEREWELICFSWKWLDRPEVKVESRRTVKGKSEKALLKKLAALLEKADVVVTHNGVSFDNKKTNAKLVEHGLMPVKPAKQIDTKRIAKQHFAFNSNKLDDLGKLLGVGRKLQRMDFSVWLACMAYIDGKSKDDSAFRLMERYNKQDVRLLEKIYLRLRPWSESHPNLSIISNKTETCPKCQAKDSMKSKGLKYTKKKVFRQYQCKACGGYSSGQSMNTGWTYA